LLRVSLEKNKLEIVVRGADSPVAKLIIGIVSQEVETVRKYYPGISSETNDHEKRAERANMWREWILSGSPLSLDPLIWVSEVSRGHFRVSISWGRLRDKVIVDECGKEVTVSHPHYYDGSPHFSDRLRLGLRGVGEVSFSQVYQWCLEKKEKNEKKVMFFLNFLIKFSDDVIRDYDVIKTLDLGTYFLLILVT